MGSATTISITRASSSFTHTLSYSFGSTSGTIATKTTSTSVSWTPALTLANQIPNALTGTCTITCETYNGSTKIGSKTCTLTLTVPSSVKPTITSLTAARVNGDVYKRQVKARTGDTTDATAYANWYKTVYIPEGETPEKASEE